MKKFLLTLDDKLHKEIKLKAIEAEKSMHQYILDCITYTWADRKRLKDSAEALAKPPMFKDVMEQVEETPYWKDDYSKPFEFIELYSRCHILLHRKRPIRSVAK